MRQIDYIPYKNFTSEKDASDFSILLEKNNIPFKIENTIPVFDVTFSNSTINHLYIVLVDANDIEKIDAIELQEANNWIDSIPLDYYLYEFTTTELVEIVQNQENWSKLDYVLAKKILNERSVYLEDTSVRKTNKKKVIQKKSKREKERFIINLGYLLAFCTGFFGVVVGAILLLRKSNSVSDGKVHYYSSKTRKSGEIILLCGLLVSIALSIVYIIFAEPIGLFFSTEL